MPIKHTGWTELTWEDVRETEMRHKMGWRQLSEQHIHESTQIPSFKMCKSSVLQFMSSLSLSSSLSISKCGGKITLANHTLFDNHIIENTKSKHDSFQSISRRCDVASAAENTELWKSNLNKHHLPMWHHSGVTCITDSHDICVCVSGLMVVWHSLSSCWETCLFSWTHFRLLSALTANLSRAVAYSTLTQAFNFQHSFFH